jgi:hypothetical protein
VKIFFDSAPMRETQEAVRRALRTVRDAKENPALSHDRLGRILKLAAYAARDHAIGARAVAFSSLDSAIKDPTDKQRGFNRCWAD